MLKILRFFGKIAKPLIALILIASAVAVYLWNKPHRDPAKESITARLGGEELRNAYNENKLKADSLYLDQVVLVNGMITEVKGNTILIDDGIFCQFEQEIQPIEGRIVIKGRVVGYDDLFGQVRLDFCQFESEF